MNYSNNPSKVRGDFFKERGKWYETIEIDMSGQYDTSLIHDAVWNSLTENQKSMNRNFDLVVLEPYHKHSHPVQLKAGRR